MGRGPFYNYRWTSQVLELTANKNVAYTQIVTAITGSLKFKIQCAARPGIPLNMMAFEILWDGKVMIDVNPTTDYEIHDYSFDLEFNGTTGNLTLVGKSLHPTDGVSCDNVEIREITSEYFREKVNGLCPCIEGYYDTYIDDICLNCSDWNVHCLTCSKETINDPSSDILCTKCEEGFYISTNGSCIKCQNSIPGCLKCSQDGEICSECSIINGFSLNSTSLTCFCSLYEFPLMTSCEPCSNIHEKCELCSTIAEIGICKTCAIDHYLLNNKCLACSILDSNCLQCPQDGSVCTICSDGFYRSGVKCLPCSNALKGCTNCSMDAKKCYSCDISNNFILKEDLSSCRKPLECLESSEFESGLTNPSVPKINYSSDECKSAVIFNKIAEVTSIATIIFLFFSIVNAKIVGIELYGVFQLAFLALVGHSPVNLFLSGLLVGKYINGFSLPIKGNYFFSNPINAAPSNFEAIKYSHSFLENINIVILILLGHLFISLILVGLSRIFTVLKIVSEFFNKQIFISLVMMNSFNIAFSAGIHFRYATPENTSNFILSTLIAVILLFYCLAGVIALEFFEINGFGEFKLKMKKNFITRLYISISIIYRLALGFWMAFANDHSDQAFLSISFILAFLLFSMINLPFIDTFQNYRSMMCSMIQLFIILTSCYYKMLPDDDKAKNFFPAQMEMCLLVFCLIVSIICLVVEIVIFLKTHSSKNKKITAEEEKKNEFHNIENSGEVISEYAEHARIEQSESDET